MAGSASVVLGAFAGRLAKAAAGDRSGRGRWIGSAAARSAVTAAALARHRHPRRHASSSSRAAGEGWSFVSGAFAGGMMSPSLFSVVKALLEKAWEEEAAARQKQ